MRKWKPGGKISFRFFVFVLVIAGAYFMIRGPLLSSLADVQFLTRQEVKESRVIEGVLIKKENLIRATAKGQLQMTAFEEQRVEAGALVARITALEQGTVDLTYNIYASSAGILCSRLDGLEAVISPDNLDMLDLTRLPKKDESAVAAHTRVDKGQPVLKIIDNLSPLYLYADVAEFSLPVNHLNNSPRLEAYWEGHPLLLTPIRIAEADNGRQVLFILSSYPEPMIHQRLVRITVTLDKLEGLLVPSQSLVFRDDDPGLYLVVKRRARWYPVTVAGELNGMVSVSGKNLDRSVRYVRNPGPIREGWPLE